jgi:hypothetical protein
MENEGKEFGLDYLQTPYGERAFDELGKTECATLLGIASTLEEFYHTLRSYKTIKNSRGDEYIPEDYISKKVDDDPEARLSLMQLEEIVAENPEIKKDPDLKAAFKNGPLMRITNEGEIRNNFSRLLLGE